jgi:hypothetical protein
MLFTIDGQLAEQHPTIRANVLTVNWRSSIVQLASPYRS